MIRHQIFFEVLAQILEDAPEWEPIICGYLTMGLFDTWVRVGPVGVANDVGVGKIRERIETLTTPYEGERKALLDVLIAFLKAPGTEPRYVAEALIAYGATLEHEGRWSLAVDVYRTIAEAFELDARSTNADFSIAGHARNREGFCLRNIKEYIDAEAAYGQASDLGKRANDKKIQLYAKYGIASILRTRGDLPGAAHAFDALLSECDSCTPDVIADVRPNILHMQGCVKHDRGHFAEAIVNFFHAYETSQNPHEKEFILVDLGMCAGDAGFRSTARNALGIVALTANSPRVRQVATVNLMEIAVLENNQAEFTRLRAIWQSRYCSPYLNAHAWLFIAQGAEKFDTTQETLAAFHYAASFAEEAAIHKIQFKALSEIERLERLEQEVSTLIVPPGHVLQPIPTVLVHVAETLEHMHYALMAAKAT